jgi:uncharacterized protein (DUF302 family)
MWFGTVLIAVGVVVNLSSVWHHVRFGPNVGQRRTPALHSVGIGRGDALLVAFVGLTNARYLEVGTKMPPTKLLIFGNPKTGTPVMLAAHSIALDLPLKILIREDDQGRVWVSYNGSTYLLERHGVPPELLPNIAAVEVLAAKAGE